MEDFFTLDQEDLKTHQFLLDDFTKSGINITTLNDYLSHDLFHAIKGKPNKLWQLFYPEFKEQKKSEYYTIRYNTEAIPNFEGGKYERPAGESSRLFRPLHLPPESIEDKKQYLIFTEGEKKAIKAVQEGFPCVALAGVWCWKQKPDDSVNNEDLVDADIIPDIKNTDFKGKTIYLCFDNDMWQKVQVKNALYNFAAYLVSEKKAKVKVIYLPENKDEKLGIDDFLIKYGAEEFKKLIAEAKELSLKSIQSKLAEEVPPPKFPLEIFPKNLNDKICDIQDRLSAPMPYVASLMISMSSILMLGKYEILVNRGSNWVEHPIIWMSLVGEPSQKKTPCLKLYKNIINKIQKLADSSYKEQLKQYKEDMAIYEKSKDTDCEAEAPQKPEKLILMTQNTNIEGLYKTLERNNTHGRLLSIVSDELAEFINNLGQYKKRSGDFQFVLQSWSYDENYSVQRASSDPISFQLGLSIIGTIQPKIVLNNFFPNGIDSTDGFPQRWLFVTSDFKPLGLKEADTPLDLSIIENIFKNLFNKESNVQYHFSTEAQKFFSEIYTYISRRVNKVKSELLKTYLEKMPAYVARFALIIHCWNNLNSTEINKDTLKSAFLLVKYFYNTYRQIAIKLMNSDVNMDKAWEYIQIKGLNEITPTKLYKSNKKIYRDAEGILEKLASRGYGRLVKVNGRGKKFIVYK